MPTSNRAPYCFKIQGQIYYQINESLYPSDKDIPKYGQLFIVDSEEAIKYRLVNNPGIDNYILNDLENIMRKYNAFAKSYIKMKEDIYRQCKLLNTEIEITP